MEKIYKSLDKYNPRYVSIWEKIKATRTDMEELVHLNERGAYIPKVDRMFDVSKIREAHSYAESKKKTAWSNVQSFLDQGIPVGLQLDCYHLVHF